MTMKIAIALSGRTNSPTLMGFDGETKTTWKPKGWACTCKAFAAGDDDYFCQHIDDLEEMVTSEFFEVIERPRQAPPAPVARRQRPAVKEA